jgi:hypothetical protein
LRYNDLKESTHESFTKKPTKKFKILPTGDFKPDWDSLKYLTKLGTKRQEAQ